MKNRFLTALIASLTLVMPQLSFAASTQVDSLIEKLVEKGVLDKQEARSLRMEIAEDAKVINEDAAKSQIPEWVQNTKLKGDARVRYQYERRANDTESRTRGRVRLRVGLDSKINDQWKMGAGLASSEVDSSGTSTDDARSTNMTLNDSFRRGDIRVDYVFGEYQPAPWGKAIFGKFQKTDYLWNTTDMLWDTDLNPGGASAHFEKNVLPSIFSDKIMAFGNAGAWVIDENGKTDKTDPYMIYGQVGSKYKEGNFDATLAGIYYGFQGVKGTALDGTASTNTFVTGTTLKHDYDSVGTSAELGLKDPTFGHLPIARAALFGDYIYNLDTGDDYVSSVNNKVDDGIGWAAGFKFGDEKVSGRNQWQLKYQYTRLEKDAWPDIFPDSDRLGGITDVRGHEWILEYGLAKNVTLAFDYYQDDRIKAARNMQKLVQADLNIKF
jgi:polyhydroxyalkanoate synthesis regulator phasin